MEKVEERLARGMSEQDPAALEALMDLYASNVYGLVQRILQEAAPREDIEECVSDVFAAAWNKSAEYEPRRGPYKTWLLILAKYKALDYRRRLSSENRMGETLTVTDFTAETDTEQIVLDRETQKEILVLIDSLDDKDRIIFYRRYYFYESVEQIAAAVGLTAKAVENRLYRARKRLKEQMETARREGIS
ncbi:sigma-70 family RNA polymerase sigma factor [Paenibacillus sp. UNC499MF]|uniref:sigma-70 family RNA polymerase sigma factor n=1 Tax=Paenibacillus sp. UNC499MF TaxID=1502751 RepID=UPI0008A098F5|nr:sigma-70 family RNA polymerase sigma factor [Paenibacillus sp. UNC499MF]SEG37082.1 RNA polymerase sigma-70 factor, ECF subfamily [Paenibacillus sp. UNC499MF]